MVARRQAAESRAGVPVDRGAIEVDVAEGSTVDSYRRESPIGGLGVFPGDLSPDEIQMRGRTGDVRIAAGSLKSGRIRAMSPWARIDDLIGIVVERAHPARRCKRRFRTSGFAEARIPG